MGDQRLANKRILITGAASGIGRATAERLVASGARVALLDVDARTLASVARSLSQAKPLAFPADIRDEAQVAAAVTATVTAFGGLDGAVNCAGILGPVGLLHTLPTAEIRDLFAVNIDGVVHCLQHELGAMVAGGGGSIVNISSAAGLVGFPTAAAYTAAKHAVVGLTKTCAIDYAESSIRVNAIAPGGVDTPLIRATTCATPEGQAMIEGMHPMKRLAQPEEIAHAALFLLSDEASFVTGETLSVDGGWVAW